jgi:hypothetical protein
MTGAYAVEYTDTFGGEANYCWVRRATVPAPSAEWGTRAHRQALMRAAKAAVGLTGARGRVDAYSHDDIAFYPYRSATVMFVRWSEVTSEDDAE